MIDHGKKEEILPFFIGKKNEIPFLSCYQTKMAFQQQQEEEEQQTPINNVCMNTSFYKNSCILLQSFDYQNSTLLSDILLIRSSSLRIVSFSNCFSLFKTVLLWYSLFLLLEQSCLYYYTDSNLLVVEERQQTLYVASYYSPLLSQQQQSSSSSFTLQKNRIERRKAIERYTSIKENKLQEEIINKLLPIPLQINLREWMEEFVDVFPDELELEFDASFSQMQYSAFNTNKEEEVEVVLPIPFFDRLAHFVHSSFELIENDASRTSVVMDGGFSSSSSREEEVEEGSSRIVPVQELNCWIQLGQSSPLLFNKRNKRNTPQTLPMIVLSEDYVLVRSLLYMSVSSSSTSDYQWMQRFNQLTGNYNNNNENNMNSRRRNAIHSSNINRYASSSSSTKDATTSTRGFEEDGNSNIEEEEEEQGYLSIDWNDIEELPSILRLFCTINKKNAHVCNKKTIKDAIMAIESTREFAILDVVVFPIQLCGIMVLEACAMILSWVFHYLIAAALTVFITSLFFVPFQVVLEEEEEEEEENPPRRRRLGRLRSLPFRNAIALAIYTSGPLLLLEYLHRIIETLFQDTLIVQTTSDLSWVLSGHVTLMLTILRYYWTLPREDGRRRRRRNRQSMARLLFVSSLHHHHHHSSSSSITSLNNLSLECIPGLSLLRISYQSVVLNWEGYVQRMLRTLKDENNRSSRSVLVTAYQLLYRIHKDGDFIYLQTIKNNSSINNSNIGRALVYGLEANTFYEFMLVGIYSYEASTTTTTTYNQHNYLFNPSIIQSCKTSAIRQETRINSYQRHCDLIYEINCFHQ